jgi:magnesium transporter
MPDDARVSFLEAVPEATRERLRHQVEHVPNPQVGEVLADFAEVQAAAQAPPEELSAEEIAAELRPILEVYKFNAGRVEPTQRVERGCWVNVVNPPRDSLPLIAAHFKIPLDFLTSSLDLDETARIEVEDQATLVTVRVPYFDEKNVDVLYFTLPIGFILVNGVILTVCSKPGTVLQDFIDGKVRRVLGHRSFLLQTILRAKLLYLSYLKQLNNAANIIQKKLEQETRNRQLLKLFNIDKSLVYFATSLRSNMLMLERLQKLRVVDLAEPNESLLEDIFTECKQAIEMADIYSAILTGMMDAFASVISNNLNVVMKLLTSLTIIMTIPVTVTSFFGMNVALPFQHHSLAFVFIIALSLVIGVLAVLFFVKKKWLEV